MAIGLLAMRRASSNHSALLVFVGLTLLSAAVVVAAPALILNVMEMAV